MTKKHFDEHLQRVDDIMFGLVYNFNTNHRRLAATLNKGIEDKDINHELTMLGLENLKVRDIDPKELMAYAVLMNLTKHRR